MIAVLVQWLVSTRLHDLIETWPVIPLVQSVHILCVAIVLTSVCFVDLRIVGVFVRREPAAAVARRFLPWTWWTVPILLTTGAVLIIGEPGRELQNTTFWDKMLLLACALSLTAVIQWGLRGADPLWERAFWLRGVGKLLAVVSLLVWVGIVFAGRMIAYTQTGGA